MIGFLELFDQDRRIDEQHRDTLLDSSNSKTNSKVSLSNTRGSKKDHVLTVLDKPQSCKVTDHSLVN